MGKNLIPVIAKELGVEIGEEFETTSIAERFKFFLDGLEYRECIASTWIKASPLVLKLLVTGHCEIIKLPFRPVLHEEYWTYDQNWNFVTVAWSDNFFDYIALKNGCVFRTYDGVHDARMSKYKELTGKEWGCDDGNQESS